MPLHRASVVILLAALTTLAAAQPAPDAAPSPAPPPQAIDRLSTSARTILENKRTSFLRLPSGFCIDATRALTARDLLRQPDSRKRNEELESLGLLGDSRGRFVQVRIPEAYILDDGQVLPAGERSDPPRNTERILRYEGLPAWADTTGWSATPRDTAWTLFMEIPGFPELRFVEPRGPDLILAAIEPAPEASSIDETSGRVQETERTLSPEYRRSEVLVRGPFRDHNFIRGQRIAGSYILYPAVPDPETPTLTPVFDLLYIEDIVPTAAQLAEAVETGKAEIATHRSSRVHAQPTRKPDRRGDKGWKERQTVKDGPPITTHTHRRTPVPIRFSAAPRPASPSAPSAPSAPSSPDAAEPSKRAPADPPPAPAAPDTLILKDGRVLRGQLVSESYRSVTFIVVGGTLAQEMTFTRAEVERVEQGER